MQPKFKLIDATKEEQADFMKKFQDLLTSTGLYYEPCPQFTRKDVQSPWEIVTVVLLQKKVAINEPIPSPFTDETIPPTTGEPLAA